MQISYDTARFAFYLGFSDDMHSMTLAGLPLGMMHALVVWPCRVNLTSVTLWFSMQFLRTTELCTAINSVRGNRFLRVTAFSRRKKCYTNLLLCQKNISSFVWCCSAFQSNSLLLSYFIPCYLLLEEMSGLGGVRVLVLRSLELYTGRAKGYRQLTVQFHSLWVHCTNSSS